jgi:hypothetical protein
MNFTLLYYRANADDYCKGCHMSSTDSEFGYLWSDVESEIAEKWGALLFEDADLLERGEHRGLDYWDITLLIDGMDLQNHTEPYNRVIGLANTVKDRLRKEAADRAEQERKKAEAEAKRQETLKAQKKEAAERKEYERLHKKFGDIGA